jgi:hypothetical protein
MMSFDIKAAAEQLATALMPALKDGGAKAATLAEAEAQKLASSVATVGELYAAGHIDGEEAKVLLRVQRDASESVLASLAEVGRVVVHQALGLGLEELVKIAGDALSGALGAAVLAA